MYNNSIAYLTGRWGEEHGEHRSIGVAKDQWQAHGERRPMERVGILEGEMTANQG